MSKATFYRVPIKSRTVYRPRRRQRPGADQPLEERPRVGIAVDPQPTCHPAPQFRRNRRFWMRRLGFDKVPR